MDSSGKSSRPVAGRVRQRPPLAWMAELARRRSWRMRMLPSDKTGSDLHAG